MRRERQRIVRRKTLHGAALLRLLVVAAMVDISRFCEFVVCVFCELERAAGKRRGELRLMGLTLLTVGMYGDKSNFIHYRKRYLLRKLLL